MLVDPWRGVVGGVSVVYLERAGKEESKGSHNQRDLELNGSNCTLEGQKW